jgi:hypothetical protein
MLQGHSNGGLPTVNAQLSAGIGNVEIHCPFSQAQNYPHFPACLANGGPSQTCQFPTGKRFHSLLPLLRNVALVANIV